MIEARIIARSALLAVVVGGLAAVALGALGVPDAVFLYATPVFIGVALALLYQMQFISMRGRIRITMAKELRGERSPVCIQCGYDAAGNVSDPVRNAVHR